MVEEPRATHIRRHGGKVSYDDRCRILGQQGLVVWFTGLSGSGKSTIAVEVEKRLAQQGRAVYRLDGDNVRHGLNADLGFSEADRKENLRRVTEVAALFKDAGLITLVAFISPYRSARAFARERVGEETFLEVYVKADLETCMQRDPKGLYAKAKKGEIERFTGISDAYEEPEHSDLTVNTTRSSLDDCVRLVVEGVDDRVGGFTG